MFEAIRYSLEHDDAYFRAGQILLKPEALIGSEERFEASAFRQAK